MSSGSNQSSGPASATKAQQDRVVKLYNDNEAKIRRVKVIITRYQSLKDRYEREIEALSPDQTPTRNHVTHIIHISTVLADCHACVLTLEDFDAEFRTEWKKMRKAGVDQREAFIKKRVERAEQVLGSLTARVRKCNEWLERVDTRLSKSAPSEQPEENGGTEEAGGSMEGGETNVASE